MELSYRIDENGGYFLDKAYALNIYNFIIENVELPNTKEENMATFLKTAENVLNEIITGNINMLPLEKEIWIEES